MSTAAEQWRRLRVANLKINAIMVAIEASAKLPLGLMSPCEERIARFYRLDPSPEYLDRRPK